MMDIIIVLKQETKVKTKLGSVEGIISAISIRHNVVTYEITYYYNGKFDYISLPESGFDVINKSEVLNIGFK